MRLDAHVRSFSVLHAAESSSATGGSRDLVADFDAPVAEALELLLDAQQHVAAVADLLLQRLVAPLVPALLAPGTGLRKV